MKKQVAVIGGGAAGMMAAITAAQEGAQVTIFEHTERLGKKILATGNGKCNLGNIHMEASCFYSGNLELVQNCLERFTTEDTIAFFESLGLCIKEKNGYLYPLAEQAAVVLDVLRYAVDAWGIKVIYNANVKCIHDVLNSCGNRCICVENGQEKAFFHSVILACGSKAAAKTGSDGSGYDLVKSLGHKLKPVLPSLVQLRCSDSFCKAFAGIRCDAKIHIYDKDKLLCEERGELQLTDYGISGIPVFQLSGLVNRYMYEHIRKNGKNGKVSGESLLTAIIDFLPEIKEEMLPVWLDKRLTVKHTEGCTVEEFFTGLLNKKLMNVFIKLAGLQSGEPVNKVEKASLKKVLEYCKHLKMHIMESNGFENAQVCTGGVDMSEVTEHLESVKVKNVYFAGEILDVDGRCGGYNLQWAWTSGYIAGKAAATK